MVCPCRNGILDVAVSPFSSYFIMSQSTWIYYKGINPETLSREKQRYLLWKTIQEKAGSSASFWPRRIRQAFWIKKLSYTDSVSLAAFIKVNSLDILLVHEWFSKRDQCIKSVTDALGRFASDKDTYKDYCAYNCKRNRQQHFDGHPLRFTIKKKNA